jgi:non-specific serine/threonine protein kinase
LTKFFGREEQLRQVETLMGDSQTRLVTFVGAGGAGKTRLAIEAATRLRSIRHDSLWLVPLADLSDGRLAPRVLADILRLPQARQGSSLDSIVAALSGRSALIVFDNAEHIVESVSEVVRQLIDRLPSLRVWVTSRQRLNLGGEREIAVPPLPVPASTPQAALPETAPEDLMGIDGVRLFVDRAQAVRPSFAITSQNAAAIAQVCSRLEGIPLALELCAAWAQTLTPEQMLTQLNHRFELLVSRRTDIATRHRSLRAAIEYSYLQLPSELQQLFVRLSVFRGGWTLEAAATVCPDTPPMSTGNSDVPSAMPTLGMLASITELRERSLVVAEEIGGGLEMRYRMLETLREFAAEQRTLALETSLRRRHAAYFLDAVEGAQTYISGPDQAVWLTRIEADHDNMRAALAWSLEKAPQDSGALLMGLRLVTALAPFWEVRGYYVEGHEWIERLLAQPGIPASPANTEILAKAQNALAYMARGRSEFLVAEDSAQAGLALARSIGEKQIMAASLQILGTLAYSRDDYAGARAYLEESLALSRELGSPALIAGALLDLGNVAMEERQWQQAWDLYSESLELRRAEGNPKRNADALNNLGLVARYRGDLATAIRLLEESMENCRAISDRSGAITLLNLGTVHRLSGRFATARAHLEEATTMCYDVDNRRALAWCFKEIGHLLCAEGNYRQGLELLSASESLRLSLGITFHPADPEALSQEVLKARAALTEDEFSNAWSLGSRLTFKQAYAKAIALIASE